MVRPSGSLYGVDERPPPALRGTAHRVDRPLQRKRRHELDVRVRYAGTPLLVPETKPTPREILASENGERLLAGYLRRRSADPIVSRVTAGRTEILLHFDH